ncbi:MsnO8 family LLM class oxidoreductase [Citroniella saccharovorans]|uniref:MsnO8 family LLM class oxidoreductase n=1 Tax=Citroniella saccharovorans TaxID=2053367 RepID=A0AAW9MSR6_9FIRM|nr:MsnO8 family LLM class oxidoreductase [Citroniella saccharovorans]MEB3429031.1 MsnO8 family LLM class oxidoreductase [Citroniella saccharovorans]
MKLSILDLMPFFENDTEAAVIERTREVCVAADEIGYNRYWIAEHHNAPNVMSSASAIMVKDLLERTKNIRVGAGGVMLINHIPFLIAETYGMLDVMYPGRVDLGLGRAPGTDYKTAQIIYRGDIQEEKFLESVNLLRKYFDKDDSSLESRPYPAAGRNIPIIILGSSLSSAKIAAEIGAIYSFAGHFSPSLLDSAIKTYRDNFKASKYLEKPYLILGYLAYASDSKERSEFLFSSAQQGILDIARGNKDLFKHPTENFLNSLNSAEKILLKTRMGIKLLGDKEDVKKQLKEFKEKYNPDELVGVTYMKDAKDIINNYKTILEASKEI